MKKLTNLSHILVAALTLIPLASSASDFSDKMDTFDSNRWMKGDWANGTQFNAAWKPDHVTHANGVMTFKLDNAPNTYGKPFSSGTYLTKELYGYGKFEAVMKTAKQDGIVNSIFTYLKSPWDEIDIEILGKDTTKLQTNYFTNGTGRHETTIALGFDSSLAFHRYTILWTPGKIRWYVDGCLKVTETGTRGPLPTHPGKVVANLWPATGEDGWTKHFYYSKPLYTQYSEISYTSNSTPPTGCASAPTPTPTPVPSPTPSSAKPSNLTGVNNAGTVTLNWKDNSSNEAGFQILKRIGTTGSYSPIKKVGANVTRLVYVAGTPHAAGDYYVVQYYTSSGNYSALSNAVLIK